MPNLNSWFNKQARVIRLLNLKYYRSKTYFKILYKLDLLSANDREFCERFNLNLDTNYYD